MCKYNNIVLFSGGQDSTTVLRMAMQEDPSTLALHITYGQRHGVETSCARSICDNWGVDFAVLHIGNVFSDSLLTHTNQLNKNKPVIDNNGLPRTFVPGRNILFLTLAASHAYRYKCGKLWIGASEVDSLGYPDCREGTLNCFEETITKALDYTVKIERPLITLSKKDIFVLADQLGILSTIIDNTHTCYQGTRSTKHPWGYGCGTCGSCLLRSKGWEEFTR